MIDERSKYTSAKHTKMLILSTVNEGQIYKTDFELIANARFI